MRIISISGLDGSGKSTQTKLLQDFLSQHNRKVYYFHAVQFSFPQKITCLKNRILRKKVESKEEKSVTKANKLQIILRKIAFIIDVFRFKSLKKRLARENFDFIITDRYFYDTIVNLAYLMNRNTPPKLEKLIPAADAAFYLKVEPESIMTRERIPDQGLDYLKRKKKLYDMYSSLWNLRVVDGSLPQQKLFENIIKSLSGK